ncbi:hypothetical protein [Nocardioides daejeonensis]|uniref:hypothetical protein n=1 Tax=Nocardioides daejeonensis TaxID=1046556 RepID=UPI000D7482A2|nr:hypothetical protein [Nocardioides daejeonensis]
MNSTSARARRLRAVTALALVAALLPWTRADADPAGDVLGEAATVESSTDPEDPTPLTAGIWRTELQEAISSAQQFTYARTIRGSSVHVSAFGLLDPEDGVDLGVLAGATECGSDTIDADTSGSWAQVPVGTYVSVADDDANNPCMTAKNLAITLRRSADSTTDGPLPVLIKVVEEAPLDDPDDATDQGDLPPAPSTDETIVLPAPGDVRRVDEPGSGFDDATEGAGTTSSALEAGEVHFYRVQVGWGQTVAARVDVEPLPKPDPDSYVSSGPQLRMSVVNPLRARVASNLLDTDIDGAVSYENDDGTAEPLTLSTGLGPVVWRGRLSGEISYLPGEHWILVSRAAAGDAEEPGEIPYTVTIEVQGQVSGAPVYLEREPGFVVRAGSRSGNASGGQTTTAAESGWFTARRGLGAGLVAGGLVCLLLGAVQIRRSR